MEYSEMKGRHLVDIQSYLDSLTDLYPEIDEDQDQILVRLAMLAHDEDPTNMARADVLLNGPGFEYVTYIVGYIRFNNRVPEATMSEDGTYQTVVLPDDGRTITIRPLTGREWRLATTDTQRLNRTAVMSGLTAEDCQGLSLLDYLTVEGATVPFVSAVLEALMTGGLSRQSLSKQDLDSPT